MDFFWNRANVQNVQEQDQNGLNKQNQSFNDFPNTFFYEFEEVVVMKIIICVEKFPKFSSSRRSAPWLPLCVLYLIRACWVENFENNRCVFDTIIRDTRVIVFKGYSQLTCQRVVPNNRVERIFWKGKNKFHLLMISAWSKWSWSIMKWSRLKRSLSK